MDSKSYLRQNAKNIRKTLDIEQISSEITTKIRGLNEYKKAQNVMIYYPLKYEINLLELLNDNKNFYLPKVEGEKLLVCPYCENLEKSELNIFEPCTNPVSPDILDLIFVPALMADREGFRLGYGGGFYDRFLAKYPKITTIIPIPDKLFIEKLPRENFDIKCDLVIRA